MNITHITVILAAVGLQRSWAQLPKLGDDVALLSRRVFFPLTLVVLVIVSEFYWSAYPFDDACGM